MTKKLSVISGLSLLLVTLHVTALNAQISLDLESGIVMTGYNDVRIPGNQGTLFSLNEDLEAKSKIYYRIRVNYSAGSRHTISLLYAPLTVLSNGQLPDDISFTGELFPANSDIDATYKFNSYRLTYRYDIVEKPRFEFGLGFTAKIRDAEISLSSPSLYSEKTNVGFVPIINFRLEWKADDKLSLLFEGDALAAPQGRAEDILIAAQYRLSDRFGLRAGYRILEGGADNDEVYNFALFHYAVVGLTLNL